METPIKSISSLADESLRNIGNGTGACLENLILPRHLALLTGVNIVVLLATFAIAGVPSALGAGAAGGISITLCALFTCLRRRETMRLAAEIDEMLHAGHRVDFSDCREGDMAVLRNEVAKMTAQLRRTAEQLKHEKTALADALANVSHQIRTPLTAMQLMVPVIERTNDDTARARKLHELETMMDRVAWLVTALLKLAKLDAGAVTMRTRTLSAASAVRAAVKPFEIALDMRDVRCCIQADEKATFEGDALWTEEAVGNLVKNCMEHTPAGGTVTVQTSEDAVAVRIRVSDTGAGIAEADLPHLFERFYCTERLATPAAEVSGDMTMPHQQGFGIGLSLAQSCISAQGGTLRAFNQAQGGACFEIAFPKVTV